MDIIPVEKFILYIVHHIIGGEIIHIPYTCTIVGVWSKIT